MALGSGPRSGVRAPHRSSQGKCVILYIQTRSGAALPSPLAVECRDLFNNSFVYSANIYFMLMRLADAKRCHRGICSIAVLTMFVHETLQVIQAANADLA